MRPSARMSVVFVVALVSCGTLWAQDQKPGLFAKLFNREKPRPKPEEANLLARLDVKLAKAKSDRQQLARLGADAAELRRLDARISGLEQMREDIVTRAEMLRAGRPRSEIEAVEERIYRVRRNLRKLNEKAPARVERAKTDLWSTPRGSRATRAYEAGSLRRSMGI